MLITSIECDALWSMAHSSARMTVLVVPSPFSSKTRRLIRFTPFAMPCTSGAAPPMVPAMWVPWP